MKSFIFATNFGFNIVTPLIICIFLARFLVEKFGFNQNIIIFAIFIGIFSGVYLVFNQLFGKNGVFKK